MRPHPPTVTSSLKSFAHGAGWLASTLAIGMLMIAAPAAMAQDSECDDSLGQNGLTQCAWKNAEKADADMAIAFAKAKAAMKAADEEFASKLYTDPVSAVKALESSQRGWLQYREGRCVIAGFAEHGGSMEPMVIGECHAEVTRVRIAELNKMAEE